MHRCMPELWGAGLGTGEGLRRDWLLSTCKVSALLGGPGIECVQSLRHCPGTKRGGDETNDIGSDGHVMLA